MKVPSRKLVWTLTLLAPLTLFAPELLAKPGAPDVDIRGAQENSAPSLGIPMLPEQSQALEALRGEAPGQVVLRWSRVTGAPSRLRGRGTMLTRPNGSPPHAIANAFLMRHHRLFNLSADDVHQMRLSRDFTTLRNGATHLTFQQVVDGIDVFGASISLNIDSRGRVINVAGHPIPNVADHVNTTEPLMNDLAALDLAVEAAGVEAPENEAFLRLTLFPVTPTDVRLAWRVTFEDSASPDAYDSIVDATDGTVLWRKNLTEYDHIPAHGDVYISDGPIPVTPKPTGALTIVPRVDASFTGGAFFPHDDLHFDWWAGDARTTTSSNNADAYADRDGDNAADAGSRPTAAAGEDFTFPINLSNQPDSYQDAAVANLFYWNNRLHDFFYVLGFDEAAGNFQEDNFGIGGSGGDSVMAEAQDAADSHPDGGYKRCNANMSTPADGGSPRMQMYICGGPPDNPGQLARDGDLDNVVIAHEYTHGVHSRLIYTSGNQRANEGWCDYFGLAVVAEPDDPYHGEYGVGDYLFFGNGDGIRFAPYTTDQSVFTLTYADLNGAASCEVKTCQQKLCSDGTTPCDEDADCTGDGVSQRCNTWPGYGPTACTEHSDCPGGDPSELCGPTRCEYHEDCDSPPADIDQGLCRTSVYRTGEIWANALWITRMNIVYKYGFAAGDRTMNELVIDGMKLTHDPAVAPTLLDLRDGLIDADLLNHNGANECLIWDAFAKMGMGYSAATAGAEDINPFEGYNVPTWCSPYIQTDASPDFGNVCVGESEERQLNVYNTGSGDLIVTDVEIVSGGSTDISIGELPETPVFISADGHVAFTVHCDRSSPGVKTATVRITSNDSGSPTLDIPYTCTGGDPEMELFIADAGSFGDVCIGDATDLNLTIQNNGTCPLEIDSVTSSDSEFIVPESSPTAVVEPGNSALVPIRYEPADVGSGAATITVTGNDGSDTVSVDGDSPPAVITTSIANDGDIGEVCAGSFKDIMLTVNNNGGCSLSLTSASLSGTDVSDFDVSVSAGTIVESGNSLQIPVRFAPTNFTDPSPRTATVMIASKTEGASGSLADDSTDVRGTVPQPDIQVAIANSGDFGNVCKGDHADLDLTLFNQGRCDLTIADISLVPDDGSFELPGDLTFPLILSHDADFTLPVRYAPVECNDAVEEATIAISSDDPDESSVNVAISGRSACPNLVIDPAGVTGIYAFPATVVDVDGTLGCYSERVVVLRNNAECPLTVHQITTGSADFAVTAPTEFPVLVPSGEETLEVTVRFIPQADADPLAPNEVTDQLAIISDDPDGPDAAVLCGESAAQSGVRILVTDITTGNPMPVDSVDVITISSKGKNLPSPIRLRFTDQLLESAPVCGNEIYYHVDQETLPETDTTGATPQSSYSTKAMEGNLQASDSFGLGQCEFRDFQLQLLDSDGEDCLLLPKGAPCTTDGECCSGRCRGPEGEKQCR